MRITDYTATRITMSHCLRGGSWEESAISMLVATSTAPAFVVLAYLMSAFREHFPAKTPMITTHQADVKAPVLTILYDQPEDYFRNQLSLEMSVRTVQRGPDDMCVTLEDMQTAASGYFIRWMADIHKEVA